jgi:hypothetical protein
MNFGFGSFTGTIPGPQPAGATIEYKIIAYDDSGNFNFTESFFYTIDIEFNPGQGLIPLVGITFILGAAVVLAGRAKGMFSQKYDKID